MAASDMLALCELLALFNLSVFVIFKNGKKQDRRRRSVQKREHEIVQGYIYGFWKNYLSSSNTIQFT